jgi:4-hydroxybenzoate polyprenyltransferase
MKNVKKYLSYCIKLLRFDSWMEWVFFFALGNVLFAKPLIPPLVLLSFSFSLSTAGIFVLNQYFDKETDKLNDLKKNLPIPSQNISPKTAIIIYFFLNILSMLTVLLTDANLLPLFLIYLVSGVCYSMPPFSLKKRPIIDVIAVGVYSGVLPFIMGLQVSHQLTLDLSLPWIMRRYQDAFFTAIPIFLFQSASHIFHGVGDYEADLKGDVTTFVVKKGKKTSIKVGIALLGSSVVFPVMYGFLDLSLTPGFLSWYLCVLAFFVPVIFYFTNSLRDPSKERIRGLQTICQKVSPVVMLLLFVYVYFIRLSRL